MSSPPAVPESPDVAVRVFEEFLRALERASMSGERIARLRKTLLEDKLFTDHALRKAVLGEEQVR